MANLILEFQHRLSTLTTPTIPLRNTKLCSIVICITSFAHSLRSLALKFKPTLKLFSFPSVTFQTNSLSPYNQRQINPMLRSLPKIINSMHHSTVMKAFCSTAAIFAVMTRIFGNFFCRSLKTSSPSVPKLNPTPYPYELPPKVRTYKQLRKHMSQQIVLLLMLKAYSEVLAISCDGTTANSTPKTPINIGGLTFTAAADRCAGANIISWKALHNLMDNTTLSMPHTHCDRTLQTADMSLHKVSDEVTIKFHLPAVSPQVHTLNFLVFNTPHDIILSSHAMHATDLGDHIYVKTKKHPPQPLHTPLKHIIDDMDLHNPEILTSVLSIIESINPTPHLISSTHRPTSFLSPSVRPSVLPQTMTHLTSTLKNLFSLH
jgi:hypothetical protein